MSDAAYAPCVFCGDPTEHREPIAFAQCADHQACEERRAKRCVFCHGESVHECAGGVARAKAQSPCAIGPTTFLPGRICADTYNARDWGLLHAHSRDLLTEWQIREQRRAMP